MSTRVISVLLVLLLGWMGLAAAHGLAPAQAAPAVAGLVVGLDSGSAEAAPELPAAPAEATADLPEGFLPASPAQAPRGAAAAPCAHAYRLPPAPHLDGPQRPPRALRSA